MIRPTGQSRRTRAPAAQRRESILKAATAVFSEVGYQRGKVSEIAARVGVTEPVVFQNFGTKAALFAAVLERVTDEGIASLDVSSEGRTVPELLASHGPPCRRPRKPTA